MISPGGFSLDEGVERPFGSKIREAFGAITTFKESFQAQPIDPFVSRDTSFTDIFRPLGSRLETPEMSQDLFRGGGGGTLIQDETFLPASSRPTKGLTPGELQIQLETARGEAPEITFEGGREPTFGTAGVPQEAVEARILERTERSLQSDIDSGALVLAEDPETFQEEAQAEFERRATTGLESFRGQREGVREIVEGVQEEATSGFIQSGVELGGLALLSTTPVGSIIGGSLLIARGSKNIQESLGFEGLSLGERAKGVGAGVVDVGFGLFIGGRGATQARGGQLSRQAIRESEKELAKQPFVFTGEVIGRGAGF